ncbi:MaoC family dehydratase [Roseateles koreensis]|uniref:MaoC family dehydratase n=1 Tax=Roseateles koreensis TaxID=2987526 RepID=A0ABT5KLT8_9BURK|nr:MaoC family dehydratase [Roseateles koreensis]MDC8783792.1 MaoC family dehydratase [Roseateles koreensis]
MPTHSHPSTIAPSALLSRVNTELGVSSWITLDQPRINAFADCSGDTQWIHIDVPRAQRESPFGGTIAHGYLTLSLLAPTTFEVLNGLVSLKQAVNYGLEKVRFLAPVRAGQRVRNRITLVSVLDKGDGRYLTTSENTIEIEGQDKPALIATSLALLS